MKSVLVAFGLSLSVILGSILYTNKIDDVTEKMSEINSEISICIENDDFAAARNKAEELKNCIEKNAVLMETLGNHEETDKIKMNLSELERFIWGEKRNDALSKCGVLDFLIMHMREASHLTIENIL